MEETERVIEVINKQTGYDKIIIGCWFNNFGSDNCSLKCESRWCRNQVICRHLEGRYYSGECR